MIQADDIDKNSPVPVHRQIECALIAQIKDGTLTAGERLPPERVLAEKLGLARGTVKQAYDTLIQKGFVNARRGSGTFIQGGSAERRNTAKQMVDKLLEDFFAMGYDSQEIHALIRTRLLFKHNAHKRVNIAFIDCNAEILAMIRPQLATVENTNYMGFLLKEALAYAKPDEIFGEYDLIITTTSHIHALKAFLPRLADKIIAIVLTADRETLVKIGGINCADDTLVLTKTKRFAQIIHQNLTAASLPVPEKNYCLISSVSDMQMAKLIAHKKTLIIPPFYALNGAKWPSGEILNFYKQGGDIIMFRYTVEKGSLIYIEEKIAHISR